jgi:hypothetical protein
MIPFKPTGIGQVAAKNVFKVSFSQALSTNPKLQAWDDEGMDSVAHAVFTGTTESGSKPLIGAIGLTSAPSAEWFPSSLIAGAAVDAASLLKGTDGFCLLSSTAPGAGGEVFFNLDYKIPHDISPGDALGHVVAVEYQYTGAAPTVTWSANKATEETPDWEGLTPQAKGSAPVPETTEIRPCSAGEGADGTGTYKLSIPGSGQEFADEIWLKDYEV